MFYVVLHPEFYSWLWILTWQFLFNVFEIWVHSAREAFSFQCLYLLIIGFADTLFTYVSGEKQEGILSAVNGNLDSDLSTKPLSLQE